MCIQEQVFCFRQGDTIGFTITVKADGADMDISGSTATMTAYRNGQTVQYPLIVDTPNVSWRMEDEDSADLANGAYFYDVQLNLPNGDVHTILKGTIKIERDNGAD